MRALLAYAQTAPAQTVGEKPTVDGFSEAGAHLPVERERDLHDPAPQWFDLGRQWMLGQMLGHGGMATSVVFQ